MIAQLSPVENRPLCRRSLAGQKCGGETELSALQDEEGDQERSVGRQNGENGHISPCHGLLRGAGADQLAHQETQIVAGDVEQAALVHVLPPAQPGSSHAATIEAVGKGTLDDLGAQLEGLPGDLGQEARPVVERGEIVAPARRLGLRLEAI